MATEVYFEGVNITDSVILTKCILTDSNGGKQDYCKISFANGDRIWNDWQPQKNNLVQIKNGATDSGIMFINDIDYSDNNCNMFLLPLPTTAKKRKTKVWRDVRLSEVSNDVANELGFKTQFYGFKDYSYKSLTQLNQTSISFLSEICKREGYNVKIFNKQIIIYNEKALKATVSSGDIKPADCNYYDFHGENAPLEALTISYYSMADGLISYTAKNANISGESIKSIICVDDIAQAERWAKNLLEYNNNNVECGTLQLKNADVFTTGSIIQLTDFEKGHNGKYYIAESIFDTVNQNCIFKINKII